VRFTFAVDGIALVMIALIVIFVPLVILYSWHETRDETGEPAKRSTHAYFALLLALESTMVGVFAAADVFLFYVFFEVMLVPMYFLIGSYGGLRRQYAAVKFFLYSLVGGLLHAGRRDRAVGPRWTHLRLGKLDATRSPQGASAGCSSASSSPSPSRRRSSRSTPGCPTPVGRPGRRAALLVGVLDKVGTFGILRYCLPLFPNASVTSRRSGSRWRWSASSTRPARGRPERPQAAGVVHLGGPLRLHRHRHLRVHQPGRVRLGALHGQPRPRHRPAVPRRRHVRGAPGARRR
jgi:NADH-quinone oxidoreductase subunit M